MPAPSTSSSRNACVACTLAKKACDRQVPRCGRCADRFLQCQYYGRSKANRKLARSMKNRPALLAPRPTHPQSPRHTTPQEEELPDSQSLNFESGPLICPTQSYLAPVISTCPDMPQLETVNPLFGLSWPNSPCQPLQVPQSIFIPTPHYNHHLLPPKILSGQGWFLHPDSWQVKRTYVPSLADPHSLFKAFVKAVKAWLSEFATNGHNIFIHHRLYLSSRGGMPSCLQDAWLTVTAYLAKTDQTEDLIAQILDDRASRLLSDQHITYLPPPEELDIRSQLAKTQALLIYTFLRLIFDNPPEQRTKALDSLPILQAWCYSLCDAAIAQAPSLYLSSDFHLTNVNSCSVSQEEIEQTSLWHAFIISESIRRTWMLVSSVLRIFNQPRPAPCGAESMDLTAVTQHRCLGFLSFTIRAGLWDAENAFQWGRLHSSYSASDPDFPPSDQTDHHQTGQVTAPSDPTLNKARGISQTIDRVPSDGKLWSESKKTIITTFIYDADVDMSNPDPCDGDRVSNIDGAVSMSVTPVFLESVGILDKILEETTPGDVDLWTNQILRMVLPSEKIDRWDGKLSNMGR